MTDPVPKFDLNPATFSSQRAAFQWAWHVARTSRRRCRVRKLKGAWRVWRAAS